MIKQLAIATLLFTSLPATAAQTDWVKTEGGAMRLIISEAGGASGIRGVLEVVLEPGWKTYWRDPGDGGIPPSLTGDGINFELQFPAPERFNENGQVFSGYHGSVGFPFLLPETLTPVDKLSAFIGVCSEVCVPFQAEFPLILDKNDADLVDKAFANLPEPAASGEGIIAHLRKGESLVLKSAATDAKLFLAPERGLYLGVPEANATGFVVKVLKEKTKDVKINYTLTTAGRALSGVFVMPN